ncbi:MAG: dockerin type I domain-containing protein [Oscillospiraceae bacterium]|nr:dockerin type I domain-containing protein [Oscillospiraceae bacterium]
MNRSHGKQSLLSALTAVTMLASSAVFTPVFSTAQAASQNIENTMEWDTLRIGGGGFVSGIVTGKKEMYLRTDVGGAYKYDYDKNEWVQLFGFLNDADRGLLSVSGIAIDPTDEDTVYFLCGCAYFSDARTVIFKTTDGGKTFTETDVTDLIQVHGNGDGRECSEPIAIDPDNPNTLYAGGDVTAGDSCLIKSTDGGKTWNAVKGYDDLGFYKYTILWPFWTDHKVRACTNSDEQSYPQQNGVSTIKIVDGKVYVGSAINGAANVHVASVKDDKFSVLSKDLPTANYPVTISDDGNGSLFVTYIAALAFGGTAGGAYKYDIASGKVTNISPTDKAIGMITADSKDPNKLFARTCGVWSDQWWEKEWTDDSVTWGDHFYRSEDGGATWEDITPGQGPTDYSTGTGVKDFVSNPLDTGGYDWIYGKAVHWGSGILIDPRDPEGDRILMTSGNGVFACDNAWDEKGIQFYFCPTGVEEVVALDMVSVPGGAAYSVIGDYDGFVHVDKDTVPQQHNPNMGSTSGIAYCPSAPNVMARVANDSAKGYYTTDGGKTWKEMTFAAQGGKLSITEISSGKYRILESGSSGSAVSYTDDFGGTWNNSTGIKGTKTTYTMVDPENPAIVYGSGINYNEYWSSNPNLTEPSLEDDHYSFYISKDYGKTFTETQICRYDMCDHTGDLAYLTKDTVAMAAGWYGLYLISDSGADVQRTDVFYCKSIGYGAPEKKGGVNTLFIYGKPTESDEEGIYRSTDSGKTWVCINTKNLYGGTGNGNFLVGDMNTFGKVYMSTVGCGIVVGEVAGTNPSGSTTSTTTTTTTTTTTSTTTTTDDQPHDVIWGDVNCDKTVDISDVILLCRFVVEDKQVTVTAMGKANGDVDGNSKLTAADATKIVRYIAMLITKEELAPYK